MSDVYQEIWNADQSGAGLPAMLDSEAGDRALGFVKVNSKLEESDPSARVLPEVFIPEHKMPTYALCRELFDNYALAERAEEIDTPEEREEVHDLVHAVADTAPMQVARDFIARATGTSLTRERWYNTIMDMWFRRFAMGGDPHLTGFEHVVVGEQEGPKAQGYHFWYKYYLDDGFTRQVADSRRRFPNLPSDLVTYLGSRQAAGQKQFPQSVTISYRWQAPDYDAQALRPLTKKIGGFFVGCSVEGLLALGTVRAHLGARAPKEATIEGARYNLKLFRSNNGRHVRTFYPVFLGPAEGSAPPPNGGELPGPVADDVRIVAALVNPEGHDPGSETVTLINLGTEARSLHGWALVDKNQRRQVLNDRSIGAGDTLRLRLEPQGVQLSNKGGEIGLFNADGRAVHRVSYSKGQVRAQGRTIVF